MISIADISKSFGKGSPNEVCVFKDFNLEIASKEFVVIVGSNGSGKTTLLNILAGATLQDKGKIMLDDENISLLKDYQRSKWIARIFQNPLAGTAPELTILENFRLASLRSHRKGLSIGTNDQFRKNVRERISVLNLGLENKLDQAMNNLSGGQRQALTLMMAIMDETKLLLMDEPTAALDPSTSVRIMDLAKTVISEFGLTALLVTHNVKDVINYGNRVILLKDGRIECDIANSQKDELKMNDVYQWFSH